MKEINVWEHVLKWGLAQNPTLLPDPDTWSDDDFKAMENTLKRYLPFIRFFQLSSKEFSEKVVPYQKLLNIQLYKDLLKYYLDDGNNKIVATILPARGLNIDSKIITNKFASYIASWIDKKEIKHPIHGYTPYNAFDNPYEFKLLLRGSRDGLDAGTFHKLCDNKPKTVTIVKVKGTNEILGGYNPLIWKSTNQFKKSSTNDSFIFSYTFMSLKDVVLSRVKVYDYAIGSHIKLGPNFGDDFVIIDKNNNTVGTCNNANYEKNIRSISGFFDIEEYEVFQIFTADYVDDSSTYSSTYSSNQQLLMTSKEVDHAVNLEIQKVFKHNKFLEEHNKNLQLKLKGSEKSINEIASEAKALKDKIETLNEILNKSDARAQELQDELKHQNELFELHYFESERRCIKLEQQLEEKMRKLKKSIVN